MDDLLREAWAPAAGVLATPAPAAEGASLLLLEYVLISALKTGC